MRVCTKQEVLNGANNDTIVTPLRLHQAISSANISSGTTPTPTPPSYIAGTGISITNNTITNTITKTSDLDNDVPFITYEGTGTPTITEEQISSWDYAASLGITPTDITSWDNKQDQLVSGQNIKTISGQSLLGQGNIDTNYYAGAGIAIVDRTIFNLVTSYNDLTDKPFIPTHITDLIGAEEFPSTTPGEDGPWARVDRDNFFRTNQTIIGTVSANTHQASQAIKLDTLSLYKESDGSFTLGGAL